MLAEITLEQALSGTTVQVITLDNRTLNIPINEIVSPGYQKIVPNEGMPARPANSKGNLIIRFSIKFPRSLSAQQKEAVKRALSGANY